MQTHLQEVPVSNGSQGQIVKLSLPSQFVIILQLVLISHILQPRCSILAFIYHSDVCLYKQTIILVL